MMKVSDIVGILEQWAPQAMAESYDNVGLIIGNPDMDITGILICLDSTEAVVTEAMRLHCNLIIAHHPIVFKGLKKFNAANYVEKTVIKAIKNDIAIYAAHTNLDNIHTGVNDKIAHLIGLVKLKILLPKSPLKGQENIGSGMIGYLHHPMAAPQFLQHVKARMNLSLIKHTALAPAIITKVAVCGGSGSFLIHEALQSDADAYITADLKYHEYFDAEGKMTLLDIGHYESEQYTIDLIFDQLSAQIDGVSLHKTGINTNPVQYFM